MAGVLLKIKEWFEKLVMKVCYTVEEALKIWELFAKECPRLASILLNLMLNGLLCLVQALLPESISSFLAKLPASTIYKAVTMG